MCSSCRHSAVDLIESGYHPESLITAITPTGDHALITGTWNCKDHHGTLEVFRPDKDTSFRSWVGKKWGSAHGFTPFGLCFVQRSQVPAWKDKSLVYAIHGDANGDYRSVEVFELLENHLIHLGTIGQTASPKLTDINGIAALPNGVIYLTNFGLRGRKVITHPEIIALRNGKTPPKDSVIIFTPDSAKNPIHGHWAMIKSGWGGANGIGWSNTHQALLIAGFHKKVIHIIPGDPQSGALNFDKRQTIDLCEHPDNIAELSNGHWIANTVPNELGAGIRLFLEPLGVPPIPYLMRPCKAVEFSISPLRKVKSTPIPRLLTQPSTTLLFQENYYTSRVYRNGIAKWQTNN